MMLLSDLASYKNDRIGMNDSLRTAINKMGHEGIGHVVIIDNGIPQGVLTLKNIIELYQNGINGEEKAIEYASYPIISIHLNRPVEMAVEMMIDYEIRRIILVDEDEQYIATLLQSDILSYYEMKIHTAQEVFQCLNRRNRAVCIPANATVYEAISLMQKSNQYVLIVMDQENPVGIVSEYDILELAYRDIAKSDMIAQYMNFPIIAVSLNEKVHHAIDIMKEREIHHLMVKGHDDHLYLLSEKDLVLNYNTSLEVQLESKLRDAKATYNLLGLAFCEIINLGSDQIIKWLNAEAMMTFQIKIDDSVSKIFPPNVWNKLMDTLHTQGGVDKEKIEIAGHIYEVTLIEAEVNNQSIMKLFLNDVSELVHLGDALQKSLEHSLAEEQEKNKLYLDVAAVMCLALDREGKIVLLNPKGCSVLETTKEEATGKDWFETFVLSREKTMARHLFDAIINAETPMVEYYENRVRTKNGEERLIAWHNALMRDNNGAIIGTFSSGEDITAIHEKQETIERMAHYDPLTNLPNRLLLNARLDHSLLRAERDKTKVVIVYVDIDDFKDINETYGYGIGDSVIQEVALKMGILIRHEDTISRIGGDEFVILLEEIHEVSECERTIKAIMNLFNEPILTVSGELQLSVSLGIAVYPEDGDTSETLLKHADIALRRAKENGANDYSFYTQEMSVQLLERVLMERELRRSVEGKEFVVYYQPQIDLHSGNLIGAEALVRWNHPTLGIVRPDIFIPLAEATNLIVPIGEQVLLQACQRIKRWVDQGLFNGRISINVSGKQFERGDVVEVIDRLVHESDLPLGRVELEITESVLMSNPALLGEKLNRLKALGIEIAIDDFGTGYSSLSYLKTFPIDKLKIDQSFVRSVCSDPQDRAIVKAIIAMADALGFKTIAEGIEEIEQGEMLRELGCQQAQGYYYARPLDEKAFERYLLQHQS